MIVTRTAQPKYTNVKINDYKKDLNFADSCSEQINQFIRQKLIKFFVIKDIITVKEAHLQFAGADKIVKTIDGKIIKIEEKIRRVTRNDILIELLADQDQYLKNINKIGWGLKNYSTDILLYYFADSNTGWFFHWSKFQKTLLKNLPNWYDLAKANKNGFMLKTAYNRNYKSLNIVIPKNVFLNAYIKEGGVII